MTLNERIGNLMREERTAKGMSLEEVAKKMGYSSKNTVSRMELGITDISLTNLEKFCAAINIDLFGFLYKVSGNGSL